MVAGILYLYRFIYGEAITALPMNGGSYNVVSCQYSRWHAQIAQRPPTNQATASLRPALWQLLCFS